MVMVNVSVKVDLEALQRQNLTHAQLQALMQGIGQVVAAQNTIQK